MRLLDPLLDFFRGKAVTIPPMDGALKPNTALDDAEVVTAALAPDNLCLLNGKLIYSSHREVRQLGPKKKIMDCAAGVASLAVSPDGKLAVALDDGTILFDGQTISGFKCPTAMAFQGESLFVCNGSEDFAPSQWVRDLMHQNRSGSLWRIGLATGKRECLARGLGFAGGLAVDEAAGRVVLSESWRHRLVSVPLAGGPVQEILPRLPAYPSRLAALGDGYVLCLFAPLNRLVEFVLQEEAYRADMMDEIDPAFWIAPTLAPARSFLEPLQNGGVKSMGVHKPWSPSRSYGLVARLDAAFQPVASYHSRANGRFHGITSAIVHNGTLVVASKGGDHVIRVGLAGGET
jgi:hypothetical protein